MVPTCFGCGAMRLEGTGAIGCPEQRLDLVRADVSAAAATLAERARERADALRSVAVRLAGLDAGPDREPGEAAWRSALEDLQRRARAALHDHPDVDGADPDVEEPGEPVTAWWSEECQSLDAPQECLGICVWRPVEWVNAELYRAERACLRCERDREQALRDLLRRLAFVTPRPGRWGVSGQALRRQARRLLADGER